MIFSPASTNSIQVVFLFTVAANCAVNICWADCELMQMQAMAAGRSTDCQTCHRPINPTPQQTGISLTRLLVSPKTQIQIELSEDQIAKLQQLRKQARSPSNSTSSKSPDFWDEKAIDVLVPYQQTKIRSLQFNRSVEVIGFCSTVTNRPFRRLIGISESQKSELTAIKADAIKDLKESKIEISKDYDQKMLRSLNSKQRNLVRRWGKRNVELNWLQKLSSLKPTKLDLLTDTNLRREIDLTETQVLELKLVYQSLNKEMSRIRKETTNSEDQKKEFIKIRSNQETELKKILLDHQWSRLEEEQFGFIRARFNLFSAITSMPFKQALNLSEKQLQRLDDLQQQSKEKAVSDADQRRRETINTMLNKITPQQRRIIRELENETPKPLNPKI